MAKSKEDEQFEVIFEYFRYAVGAIILGVSLCFLLYAYANIDDSSLMLPLLITWITGVALIFYSKLTVVEWYCFEHAISFREIILLFVALSTGDEFYPKRK